MQKRTLRLFVSLFIIIFLIGFTSALTCNILSETDCTSHGGTVLMKLSSLTNAHAELATQAGYADNVLCCDGSRGITCSSITNMFTGEPINKITSLSSLTNAHIEGPDQNNYLNDVCYEDLDCITTAEGCPTDHPLDLIRLSSTTNAHEGTGYSTKICCLDSRAGPLCLLSSASWEKTSALNGETVNMNVAGTNCNGATITYEIFEKDTVGGDDSINTRTGTYPSRSWDATWMVDDESAIIGAFTNNKYYFIASVGSSQVTSNLLGVSQRSIKDACTQYNIQTCGGYSGTSVNPSDFGQDTKQNLCSDNPCEIYTGCPNLQSGETCTCAWSTSTNTCVPAIIPVIPVPITKYCGDSNVDRPNSGNMNEDCDPDAGTSVFLDTENTCQEVNSIFTGGTLGCHTGCTFNTAGCVNPNPPKCGDNSINVIGEYCDGTDLGQYNSCEAFGYSGGTLGCYPAGNANECEYDLSGCTDPGLHICGDRTIDTPNSGNMNEECDGPLASTSCVGTDSYTGGSKSCSTGCLIDISQCTGGTPSCNDGVVNQLTEECDKTDLQGLTCGYLGFSVSDGLSCSNTCKLDTSGCVIEPEITTGACLVHTIETDTNGCDDGILTYDWWCEWVGNGERPADTENYPLKTAPKSEVAPCIAQAQLPFFGIYQFIISFVLILGIYFLVMRIRKRK